MTKLEVEVPDICEDVDYQIDPTLDSLTVHGKIGAVYAIEDSTSGEIVYIGKTANLRNRMNQYRRLYKTMQHSKSAKMIHALILSGRVKILACRVEEMYLGLVEAYNINKYKPKLNSHTC